MANTLFFDSFDHPNWSYDKLWTSKSSTSEVVGSGWGRNGNGFKFASASASRWLGKNFGEYVPEVVLGFAYKLPATASTGFYTRKWETLCQFQSEDYISKANLWLLAIPDSSAGTTFRLAGRMFHSTLGLDWIYSGSNIVPATSTVSLAVDTWYYLETHVKFNTYTDGVANSDGYLKVYLDGELIIEALNIKTVNDTVTGTGFGSFLLGGYGVDDGDPLPGAFCYGYFDDLYAHYGDSPTRLGDITVAHAALTADGLLQEWTPSTGNAWEILNDNLPSTYISSNTLNEQSSFAQAGIATTPETIHGVQVCALGQKTDSGSRNLILTVASRSYQGVLTATGNPAVDDTVTIGTSGAEIIYTFKDTLTTANQVKRGASAADTFENLAAAILGGEGEGTAYGTGTTAHTKINAAVVTTGPDTLTVTGIPDEDLSTQATTESSTALSWAAATLAVQDDEDVSASLPMSANTKNFINVFTVDPRTNAAWTKDWASAAQIGVKVG
jgi:hypothetical protein